MIGTTPNSTIRKTAGPANAHPAAWSDWSALRTLATPSPLSFPRLRRDRELPVRGLRGFVQRGLRIRVPGQHLRERLPERRGDLRVLGHLRPRLRHVGEVRRERALPGV